MLGGLGAWGSALATVQLLLLERGELVALSHASDTTALSLTLAFAAALFAMYGLTAVFLQR